MIGLNYCHSLCHCCSLHCCCKHLRRGDLDSIHQLGKLPPLLMGLFLEEVGISNRRDVGGHSKVPQSGLVGIAIVEWEWLPGYRLDLAAHIVAEQQQHYIVND